MNTNKLSLLYGFLLFPPWPTSLEASSPQFTEGKDTPKHIFRTEVTRYQFLTFGSEPKSSLLPGLVWASGMASFEKH